MLRNYTSEIPVVRSISAIEEKLVASGARDIIKSYEEDGRVKGLVFDMPATNGKRVCVQLPARAERVFQILKGGIKRSREGREKRLREQAERTAWKNLHDWVDIQLTLIRLDQVEPLEVFLPYIFDGKRTFYAAAKADGFKMLPERTP